MKHLKLRTSITTLITSTLLLATSQARPPAGDHSQGNHPNPPGAPAGQASELGLVHDGFEAYRNLQFDGDAFFSKTEKGVHAHYRKAYRSIVRNVVRERITMAQAQEFLSRLVEIGKAHAEASDHTEPGLEKLDVDIEVAITERADLAKMTPEINRIEWLMEEFVRFAANGGLKTSAASRLGRDLESLLSEETSAKSGSNFRDRERRDLMKATLETWVKFIRQTHS
jgi:hypothetical protein